MVPQKRLSRRFGFELALALLAVAGLAVVLSNMHATRAGVDDNDDDEIPRQVTVFGVLATPGTKTVDSRLSEIHAQLDKLVADSGFKLLDARSEHIIDGESITCSLGNGYSLTTSLVKSLDENGKVDLRCELFRDQVSEFSTLVKTPANQLFFCQRHSKTARKS